MLNKKVFHEFLTEQEAYEWAMHYYGSWLKNIWDNKNNNDENSIANLLYAYTGSMNMLYNNFLRGFNVCDEDEIEEYCKSTAIITKEISKFQLQENIIVYRYTHKNLFRLMFESSNPQIGKVFTEKGFMSTTLVADLLKKYAKQHQYNCVLKLYLPRSTKGAYINFDNSLLNEQEFILPPNSKFRLIKKYFSLKYRIVYECELISQ